MKPVTSRSMLHDKSDSLLSAFFVINEKFYHPEL